jgi:hypothetical protein
MIIGAFTAVVQIKSQKMRQGLLAGMLIVKASVVKQGFDLD